MYPNRERFPDSPLALVAAEVRFTDSARLRQQDTLDKVAIALEGRFPFAHSVQQSGLHLVVGGSATPAAATMPVTNMTVLTSSTNTESITLTSASVIYETTDYVEFTSLLDAVQQACQALIDAEVRPAIRRIGLRYIDEVRVPTAIADVRQWSEWIDRRLVDHVDVGPVRHPVRMTQGVTTYDLGDGKGLNFHFAALNQGAVVSPQILRRPRPAGSGPFFVLDYDGFQEFPGDVAVLLDPGVVRNSLEAVHAPAGEAFQNSITDKARELFRGNQP